MEYVKRQLEQELFKFRDYLVVERVFTSGEVKYDIVPKSVVVNLKRAFKGGYSFPNIKGLRFYEINLGDSVSLPSIELSEIDIEKIDTGPSVELTEDGKKIAQRALMK